MSTIYVDHNATSPMFPEVWEAMEETQQAAYGNPSSPHRPGRVARRILEESREGIASLLGATLSAGEHADRLIFTSGGTEANNLAIWGRIPRNGGPWLCSSTAHPSMLQPMRQVQRHGVEVRLLPCRGDGAVDVGRMQGLLEGAGLLCVELANGETGVIEPMEQIGATCAAQGIPVHVDAVQGAGKLAINFRAWCVSTLSIAAHKFNGPRGIGALLIRDGYALSPLMQGGGQESALRPGTECPVLAVGMHVALRRWSEHRDSWTARLADLRDRFEANLREGIPNIIIHGGQARRLPQTSCIAFPGVRGDALLMALDLAGVACSLGTACASGALEPSPALLAMGVPRELALQSLRFSFGPSTSVEEAVEAARRITSTYNHLRSGAFCGFSCETPPHQRGNLV